MVIVHIVKGTILSRISVVSKSTINSNRYKYCKCQAQNTSHVEDHIRSRSVPLSLWSQSSRMGDCLSTVYRYIQFF